MHYVIYNNKANNLNSEEKINNIISKINGSIRRISVYDIRDYKDFFSLFKEGDDLTVIGGDGTFNHFVNDIKDLDIKHPIYFIAGGSGNDFLKDMDGELDEIGRLCVNDLINKLPTVYVNGLERKFLNGIGYGIDGYVCETADKFIHKHPYKKINYAAISVKGLLFHYKRPKAEVIIDGKHFEFKKVYIASTMEGRYYGGGMKIAPDQDRLSKNGELSVVVINKWSRIGTIMNFYKIFKGKHVKDINYVHIYKVNKEVEIRFNIPTALQIDGETVSNVYSYKVII